MLGDRISSSLVSYIFSLSICYWPLWAVSLY